MAIIIDPDDAPLALRKVATFMQRLECADPDKEATRYDIHIVTKHTNEHPEGFDIHIARFRWDDFTTALQKDDLLHRLDVVDAVIIELDLEERALRVPRRYEIESDSAFGVRVRQHNMKDRMAWQFMASLSSQMWVIPSDNADTTAEILKELERNPHRTIRKNSAGSKKPPHQARLLDAIPYVSGTKEVGDTHLGTILWKHVDVDAFIRSLNMDKWDGTLLADKTTFVWSLAQMANVAGKIRGLDDC